MTKIEKRPFLYSNFYHGISDDKDRKATSDEIKDTIADLVSSNSLINVNNCGRLLQGCVRSCGLPRAWPPT